MSDPVDNLGAVDFLASVRAVADRAQAERLALACGPAHLEGDIAAGVDACVAAGALAACAFKNAGSCPRNEERALIAKHLGRLVEIRVPGAQALLDDWQSGRWHDPSKESSPSIVEVLASTVARRSASGARCDALPVLSTPPLLVVRAFLSRLPARVEIAPGAVVEMTGGEWFLLMGGNIGVGKTCAACVGALESKGAIIVDAREVCRYGDEAQALLDRARGAALAVVDDLGTERDSGSGYAVDTIVDLLTFRRDHRRRTILTTNLRRQRKNASDKTEPEGLAERYGARLMDRLREGSVQVGFRGESLRGKLQ